MSTNKTRHFVLVAIASLVAATLTLAPASLNASTQEEENGDDDRALTQTITKTKDGEPREKNVQSDEHSSNAGVKITRSSDREVDKEDRSDDPAHTGTIVFEEDGEVIKEENRVSSEKSSKSASKVKEMKEGGFTEVVKEITQESAPQSSEAVVERENDLSVRVRTPGGG